jgi:hypothetical protein
MPNELGPYPHHTAALTTIYFVIGGSAATLVNASTGAIMADTDANWPSADIAATDTGHSKSYYGNLPSGMAEGAYNLTAWLMNGATASRTADTLLGGPVAFEVDTAGAIIPGHNVTHAEYEEWTGDTDLADDIATLAARLSAGSITLVGGVIGYDLVIRRGDAYNTTTGRTRIIVKAAGDEWPSDLTGWVISFYGKRKANNASAGDGTIGPITCAHVTETGDSQSFRIDLTAAQTTALAEGRWTWQAKAVSGLNTNTLCSGNMIVQPELPVDS